MNTSPYQQAFARIRAEYVEMPGMRLTAGQVQRLSGVDVAICRLVLDDLVRSKFLHVAHDGSYARGTDDGPSRLRTAKAEPYARPPWSHPAAPVNHSRRTTSLSRFAYRRPLRRWLLAGYRAECCTASPQVRADSRGHVTTFHPQSACTAANDASEISWRQVQYLAHGSIRRRFRRLAAVGNVHRSGEALKSLQSSGMETVAPARARGE